MRLRTSVTPTIAKALAALHAIIFARDKGYEDIIFERDALQVVNVVNSNTLCKSNFGHFVEDTKVVLVLLRRSSFVHVNRQANTAAHVLAKEACNHATEFIWWHFTPSCIDGIIRKEGIPPSS